MGVSGGRGGDPGSPRTRRREPRAGRDGRGASVALIFVGGSAGTLLRAGLEEAFPAAPEGIPWTTFAINVGGAFLLGLLLESLLRRGADDGRRRTIRLTAGTGFLGAFTTYSTFAVETVHRLEGAATLVASIYALGSVIVGVGAAAAGYGLAHRTHRRDGRTAVPS